MTSAKDKSGNRSRTRAAIRFDAKTERKLLSYAVAASAAGVSVLALAAGAEAKVVYTPTHHVIGPNTQFELDLNNDGTTDFLLSNIYGTSTGVSFADLFLSGAKNSFAVTSSKQQQVPLALAKGAKIGAHSQRFRSAKGLMARIVSAENGSQFHTGKWTYATKRFLGLKFSIQGRTHYGWARLSVYVVKGRPYVRSTLTGYAYETIANKSIIAGKTHGPDVVTIQPASLGHLAQGASAIPAWRAQH
jgi:hypothetical protein